MSATLIDQHGGARSVCGNAEIQIQISNVPTHLCILGDELSYRDEIVRQDYDLEVEYCITFQRNIY